MTQKKLYEENLKVLVRAAYLWGRDNGVGRSERNFNDFLMTQIYHEKKELLKANILCDAIEKIGRNDNEIITPNLKDGIKRAIEIIEK